MRLVCDNMADRLVERDIALLEKRPPSKATALILTITVAFAFWMIERVGWLLADVALWVSVWDLSSLFNGSSSIKNALWMDGALSLSVARDLMRLFYSVGYGSIFFSCARKCPMPMDRLSLELRLARLKEVESLRLATTRGSQAPQSPQKSASKRL